MEPEAQLPARFRMYVDRAYIHGESAVSDGAAKLSQLSHRCHAALGQF
jgi:hypothetical protein